MKKVILFFAGFFLIAALFFWAYFPALSHYRELKFQEEDMDKKISALDKKIEALQEEKNLLKNDVQYLERVIRGELGLVKPGEIVYKFVEDPALNKKPASKIPDAKMDQVAAEAPSGIETNPKS